MHSPTHFKLQELRSHNIQKIMEALLALLSALFVTALLPSLLVRYVYSQEQLLEQPPVLELIPLVSFVAAALYVIYVVVTNMRRSAEIKELQLQLTEFGQYADESAEEMISQEELDELEDIVEQAINEVEEAEAEAKEVSSKAEGKTSKSKKDNSKKKKSKSKSKSKKKSKK